MPLMPYTLHFHDPTDNKPMQLSGGAGADEAMQEQRWTAG